MDNEYVNEVQSVQHLERCLVHTAMWGSISIVITDYHDVQNTQIRTQAKSILPSLATPPNAKCTGKKKGQRGSWSSVRSSGWQGKYPDARQGKLFSMMASGMLAYPTDICVGCCVAIPGKFGKQLAAPKPHTAFHLSCIRLTGNAITSCSERTALLFPSQPIPDPPGSQALPEAVCTVMFGALQALRRRKTSHHRSHPWVCFQWTYCLLRKRNVDKSRYDD